ncbi:MAG: S41 family peptidase [Oscillibacter sp.]|nr:S41 family peptidase [Oscillibacter sp.]
MKYLVIIIVLINLPLYGQKGLKYSVINDYPDLLVNRYSNLFSVDSILIDIPKDYFHPHLFESISVHEKDSIRKCVIERIKKDTLNLTEALYCFKPYFERLQFEDPHFRPLIPWFITKDNIDVSDKISILPWDIININDTIIIDYSYEGKFYRGDRILEINHVPIEKFISHACTDRYSPFFIYQSFYHYAYSPVYSVKIERQNQIMDITTNGITYKQYIHSQKQGKRRELYSQYKTGYFQILDFKDNNKLIKELTNFVRYLKKSGCTDLILDLRKNKGGNGDNMDRLLSLFIDKDTVNYLKEVRLRVSEANIKEYDFLSPSMIGELVNLPEENFVRSIPLKHSEYQNLSVYILISKNTASTAASFVNIIQYNGSGILIGEPLSHNALKYGEIAYVKWDINPLCAFVISTVEHSEYTQSPDGQIYPDIEIPYVASEYMQGGDPLLEKLLKYIQGQKR